MTWMPWGPRSWDDPPPILVIITITRNGVSLRRMLEIKQSEPKSSQVEVELLM